MTTAFAFLAIDPSGHRVRGTELAASPGILSETLEGRGLVVLKSEQTVRRSVGASRKRRLTWTR